MISFVLRIIVIERFSARGFPLKEASEHCFLSIKVLFGVVVSYTLFFHYYFLEYFLFFFYYNRFDTLQVISKKFPWQKIVG